MVMAGMGIIMEVVSTIIASVVVGTIGVNIVLIVKVMDIEDIRMFQGHMSAVRNG